MYLSKAKKGFTVPELLIGLLVISVITAGIVPSLKIYLDMFIKSEEKNTGDIYNLSYDIQRNKSYGKKFIVSDEQDYLKIYRSEGCFVMYKFYKTEASLKKSVLCNPIENIIELDNTFIIPNVTNAEFTKGDGIIKLKINSKNENFSHDFIF